MGLEEINRLVGVIETTLTFGCSVERVIIGIYNAGKFSINRIGNDISSQFNMKLNMINQSVEYNHPQLRKQILRINRGIKPLIN